VHISPDGAEGTEAIPIEKMRFVESLTSQIRNNKYEPLHVGRA
jgi:hypothetical protein